MAPKYFLTILVVTGLLGISVASAIADMVTRVRFRDGSWVDVITDRSGTYTRDGAGRTGPQSGGTDRGAHERAVRDQEKSFDFVRSEPSVKEPKDKDPKVREPRTREPKDREPKR